ncbi:MAG: sensor histidine kinase, partial [Thermodesulfobacteriota bacterium]
HSQGELIGSIAHDLKGLINGIEGGMYFISSGMKKEKPERIGQGHEMMKRNLDRIRRTVANQLYYVKDREINWNELTLRDLVSSAVETMKGRADELGVRVEVKVGEGTLEGDEFAMRSMLVNVLDYALEVCHRCKQERDVAVLGSVESTKESALFDLRAEGFCMEEETRALALADAYMPRGVDRSHLGLFIANKIARSHKGSVEIEATPEPPRTRLLIKVPSKRATG